MDHEQENKSEKNLSTRANCEMDLEDRELLRRLLRLLPKVEDKSAEQRAALRSHEVTDEAVQAVPDRLNVMHSRSRSEGYSVSPHASRSAVRLPETEPLRFSRVSNIDMLEVLGEFEVKCSIVRNKFTQLQKIVRLLAEGDGAPRAAAKVVVHLESVKAYLKQCVDSSSGMELSVPSEVHGFNLSSALTSLAQSSRDLARILIGISDLMVDLDDLEPLESLAQLAELEGATMKDNKPYNRISGIRFRQQKADLLVNLCKTCNDVAVCISGIIKAAVPVVTKRQEHESSKHLAMACIAILFSVIVAVMLSASAEQGSTALNHVVGGFWFISLGCGVASAITSGLGLMWWESASYEVRMAPRKTGTWIEKGSTTLFVASATLFSIGLCIFAFSSSQAVPTRAIIIVFTSLHFLGLLIFFTWLARERQSQRGASRMQRAWHSMRRLAQLSIRTSIAPPPEKIELKDVEQGLQSDAAPGFVGERPIIQVTDTEPVSGFATNDVTPSDPASISHSNLVVPSAYRISSDSSRSLPPLPRDVQVIRCMRYSPNGMFLCIGNCNPQERCTIFSADSPAIVLGELKLVDVVQQIEWSPDGEYILLRLSHSTYIWNAMPSNERRPAFIIHQEVENVKWHPHSEAFFICERDILTSFDVLGNPIGVFQIPATTIRDFSLTQDGSHVICLATVNSSALSGASAATTQKLIVYDLDRKAAEQMLPVGRDAHTIVRSTASPDIILINFVGTTPPQLWQYVPSGGSSEKRSSAFGLIFKRAMNFKAPTAGRFSGKGIFGGTEDILILSVGEDGDMFMFARDSGQLVRHISTARSNLNPDQQSGAAPRTPPLAQCIAWDPDILSFTTCMGFANGTVWQWKIPFDDLSQNTSSFAVMTLDDEDTTMIRTADT